MFIPMVLILFSPLGIDLFLPALGDVASALDASRAQSQWAISAFVLALGIGQIPFGSAADRVGRRGVSLLGLGLFMVGSLVCGFAASIEALLAGRFLQGLGASATTVCAFTIVRDHYDGDEASAKFSWLTGALNAVPSLAPALGAVLVVSFGWRSAFAVYAALAGIGMAIAWTWQVETRRAFVSGDSGPSRFFEDAARILKTSRAWLPALTCIAGLSFVISYVSLAPVVLMDRLDLTPQSFGVFFGLNGLLILLFSFFVPRLNQHFGVARLIRFGILSVAVASAALLVLGLYDAITSPVLFMAPIALASIGFATSFGNAHGVAMEPFRALAGTASGILGAVQMVVASIIAALIVPLDLGSAVPFGGFFAVTFWAIWTGWRLR